MLYSMGWIFHLTDKKFDKSIFADGLRRRGRDAMHFMYENDGKSGYVIKELAQGRLVNMIQHFFVY